MEIWKDIIGFEGIYQVSNKGRLKSFKRNPQGRILSNVNKNGSYFSVILCFKNKKRYCRLHVLVAEAFVPNPDSKPEVNHKDLDKQNTRADNLEWVTRKENHMHAVRGIPSMVEGMNYYNKFVRPIPILQISLKGDVLALFSNAKEASETTGICQRNILQVAAKTEYKEGKTRKQAGGFMWRFKNAV